MRIKQPLTWELGYSDTAASSPASYIPAAVPGAVQLAMRDALGLPDYHDGMNVREYEWMEKKFWHYRSSLTVEAKPGLTPYLVLESIEYAYDIFLDGVCLVQDEGIYRPVVLSLAAYSGREVQVDVLVHPAPVREGHPRRQQEFSDSCKAPFAYGWDWSPRCIALGLCGDAYVEYRSEAVLDEFDVTYTLSETFDTAVVSVSYRTAVPARALHFALTLGDACVYETDVTAPAADGSFSFTLEHPSLWWPNGQGDQVLYGASLTSVDSQGSEDTRTKQIGFRRVRLVTNEGEWERDYPCPRTQNCDPITLEINGRRIFGKGSNWVPPDFFLACMTDALYETQIKLAHDAHMNLFRVWGGGYVHHDSFFSLCDRYGILVWQEFTQACALYSEDEHYLDVLNRESCAIIRRLRSHPCLAIWCGGNELLNNWSRMTIQSLSLRLLGRNCYDLDRNTPFLPASPVYGMGHGPYTLRDYENESKESLTIFEQSHMTAYTEFGCGAPSPYEYIQTFIPPEEIDTLEPGGSYELHHAFKAWCHTENWFGMPHIEYFLGKPDSVKDACDKGTYLQALMYAYDFEEARKQWPYCSMAVNWCYNEPWPNAAGNSLVNYPDRPKPSYYAVQNALRDAKVSIRPGKLRHTCGDACQIGIWLLNDTPKALPEGDVTVYLIADDTRTKLLTWHHDSVPAGSHKEGPGVTITVPHTETGRFALCLEASDPALSDTFTLLCREEEPATSEETIF